MGPGALWVIYGLTSMTATLDYYYYCTGCGRGIPQGEIIKVDPDDRRGLLCKRCFVEGNLYLEENND